MARTPHPTQAGRTAGHSNGNGAARRSTAAPVEGNRHGVAVKSLWSPEIQSELEPVAPISPQELEAICILLGDDLDRLFSR